MRDMTTLANGRIRHSVVFTPKHAEGSPEEADLLGAIRATEATQVVVTHGSIPVMVRWLRQIGLDAKAFDTEYGDDDDEATGVASSEATGVASSEATGVASSDAQGPARPEEATDA